MDQTIPLSQKLYLLAIHPEKGGIVSASYSVINYVLAGSLLLEMQLNGNIKFENKRVIFLSKKTDNETLGFLLEKMSKTKSSRRISYWINRFVYSNKKMIAGVQQGLVSNRLIRMEARHFLFFKWKSPVIVNKSAVYHLVDEVRNLIFKGTSEEEDLILLSFIRPAKLQSRLYPDRHKRRDAEKKLKNILIDNPVSKSVEDAISAAQAVAASIAIITATSASH
jgi:hypothetical protein